MMTKQGNEHLDNISKSTRKLYRNIRSELIGIHYRVLLVRQLFTLQDTNDLLNRTAILFFSTLKWDLMNTIAIAVSRLTDPAKSIRKFKNASLQQIIDSLDPSVYPGLVQTLQNILVQIKAKASRIENWRNKWTAHRDLDVVQGNAPMPVTALTEIEEVLSLIGKFLNEFENAFQDSRVEINLVDKSTTEIEEIVEKEELRIDSPTDYSHIAYQDDGDTIIKLIKQIKSLENN